MKMNVKRVPAAFSVVVYNDDNDAVVFTPYKRNEANDLKSFPIN